GNPAGAAPGDGLDGLALRVHGGDCDTLRNLGGVGQPYLRAAALLRAVGEVLAPLRESVQLIGEGERPAAQIDAEALGELRLTDPVQPGGELEPRTVLATPRGDQGAA